MARVVFENVRKEYEDVKRGSFTAVAGSSFVIEDKEFVVFVGPSGCGKTTSLRMIAGLEQQTSGDILIGDRVVNQLHPKDRDIAMVFQDYALYPHMTVRENLSFGLKNLKKSKAEIEEKVKSASSILGLDEMLERKPR
ncbi:ATP-binding cassette domain-containing protein, partial [Paenibacillus validus]